MYQNVYKYYSHFYIILRVPIGSNSTEISINSEFDATVLIRTLIKLTRKFDLVKF